MRAIIAVMLAVQVGMLIAVAAAVLRRPAPGRRLPIWSSLTIPPLIAGMVSFQIADRHDHAAGAEILRFGAAVLLGIAISMALVGLRERRSAAGQDASDRPTG